MKDTIILAGDMGWQCGLAVGHTEAGYLGSTCLDVTAARKRSLPAAVEAIAKQTKAWLFDTVGRVDLVYYEEPTQSRTAGSARLAQFAAITALLLAAEDFGARRDFRSFWPRTLKKRGAGDGRAEKEDMQRAAAEWVGWQFASHDEADAVLLLKIALEENGHV